jgi:hypothetical protein
MPEASAVELREYLRRINPPPNPAFDEFVGQIEALFKLRVRAEDRYSDRPHTAISRAGALPLDWCEIAAVLSPEEACPPENVVTQFARDNLGVIDEIFAGMRRVLVRGLEKVDLGSVQQVDSHCLRWLTRQPGRDGVEKAGPSQRILAVVRREHFNTLENRVFKDFLVRAAQDAAIYLRKNESRFPAHATVSRVRSLRGLCEESLRAPDLDKVGSISELPVPNYVLRHDRRYNRIWKAYVEMVRQAAIAERLWNRRAEVAEAVATLHLEVRRHTDSRARFHCPIWFNPLDGARAPLDRPFFKNELADRPVNRELPSPNHDVVIDLTSGSLRLDLLIYGCHSNAKPYLQDYQRPSVEDCDTGKLVYLPDILARKDPSELRDYFEQLQGRVGGERWFILIPDNWDPLWQEAVIKACPIPRRNVFLVWRSIASMIGAISRVSGFKEGDEIAVLDVHQDGSLLGTRLALTITEDGTKLVPQRRAYRSNAGNQRYYSAKMRRLSTKEHTSPLHPIAHRYLWPIASDLHDFINRADKFIIATEGHVEIPLLVRQRCSLICDHRVVASGVSQFADAFRSGKIPFYDEVEELSLIVQTDDENVVAKTLVPANEKWPGGRTMDPYLLERAAVLKRGDNHVNFLLCMGEVTREAPLRVKRHSFTAALPEDYALDLAVRVMPGQGMANIAVHAQFLREPIELDFLNGMSDHDEAGRQVSIAGLEEKMLRSFPPEAPHVVADSNLWQQVRSEVQLWLRNSQLIDGGWFAKAEDLYPAGLPLPAGARSIERLRRKNVFGNAPGQAFPTREDFSQLFVRLRRVYDNTTPTSESDSMYATVVRLIAWTYQSDNPLFGSVREVAVARIYDYANNITRSRPLPQEYTLCANLCSTPAEWNTLWASIYLRLQDQTPTNNVDEELRLLYNLLQFHPMFLNGVYKGSVCWDMMSLLLSWYARYNEPGPTGSKRVGYVLKCMLYMLRCRKFDGKRFLMRDKDDYRYRQVRDCLKDVPKASAKRELHRVVCDYLDGRGTIEGIPTS